MIETKEGILNDQVGGTMVEGHSEELVKRSSYLGTPFEIVTTDEGSFVTLGAYRLTEVLTYDECLELLETRDYGFLFNWILCLIDFNNKQKLVNNEQ